MNDVPDQRPIDLPAALLLATAALALSVAAGAAFLLVTVVAVAGRDAVALDAAWTAAAAGSATVALLAVLTRSALRPAALAVAGILGAVWPLTGAPLPAAALAILALAAVVRWGARSTAVRHTMPVAALCAALALACLIAAASAPPRVDGVAVAADKRGGAPRDASPRGTDPAAHAAAAMRRGDAPSSARGGVRDAVRAYYRALDRRAFARAWRSLAPAVRAEFGGFDRWRAGFVLTLSSRPGALEVHRTGDLATVTHRLVARDRADCGVAVREFTVRWTLRPARAGWRAVALSGAPVADPPLRCE